MANFYQNFCLRKIILLLQQDWIWVTCCSDKNPVLRQKLKELYSDIAMNLSNQTFSNIRFVACAGKDKKKVGVFVSKTKVRQWNIQFSCFPYKIKFC